MPIFFVVAIGGAVVIAVVLLMATIHEAMKMAIEATSPADDDGGEAEHE